MIKVILLKNILIQLIRVPKINIYLVYIEEENKNIQNDKKRVSPDSNKGRQCLGISIKRASSR